MKGYYFQLYNIHGLVRGSNLELGRNSDTGGQTKYVMELANALSEKSEIGKVEIITRLISDKDYSADYSKEIEAVNDKLKIIRIGCGGKKYIKKELLWDHLEEFSDNSIKYIKANKLFPDIIHSHYADAGYVSTNLTKFFGVPLVYTAHSLGIVKMKSLLADEHSPEEIERKYNFIKRIHAEEDVIFYADKIITSTEHEIGEQYIYYSNLSKEKFAVIPPSINLNRFYPYHSRADDNFETQAIRDNIRTEFWNFYSRLDKPIILSICRPDKRKNISGLIAAYGEDKELQEMANLAIFAGIRKDIQQMPDNEREILTEILLLMDKYDLYGKMAIPKKHDIEFEVPELFRMAAESGGVFVNSSLSETFGLTLIEAAASGLPVVATKIGGPSEIINNLENGFLVDPADPKSISSEIKEIIQNNDLWEKFSIKGLSRVHKYYSWNAHVNKYLATCEEIIEHRRIYPKFFISVGKKLLHFKKMMIFDIDDTLTGNFESLQTLNKIIKNVEPNIGIGVATGRTIVSAVNKLKEIGFVMPDFIISSVGSEMYYKNVDEYVYSQSWDKHISAAWKPHEILPLLSNLNFIKLQVPENQRKYKISYNLVGKIHKIKIISQRIRQKKIKANLILSHDAFVDILPYRASKGRAIRFLGYKWNIPYENILVAGDSGNDEDMLRGELLGIVVGNHTDELSNLKGRRKIYFAEGKHAAGVIEGIDFYNFLKE
jgi:sucrose-phosphate synthase